MVDVRVLQDGLGQRLLAAGHRVEGGGLRGLGDDLDQPGVLQRKEALRDHDVEQRGQAQGQREDRVSWDVRVVVKVFVKDLSFEYLNLVLLVLIALLIG